jgi:hypothetical protein
MFLVKHSTCTPPNTCLGSDISIYSSSSRLYKLSKTHYTLDRARGPSNHWLTFFTFCSRSDLEGFLGSEATDELLRSVAGGPVLGSHLLGLQDLLTAFCLHHRSLLFGFLVYHCNLVLHLLCIFSLLLFQLFLNMNKPYKL